MSIFSGVFKKKQADGKKPAELYSLLAGEADGYRIVAIINTGYRGFGDKAGYPWFLSVLTPLIDPRDDGLPNPTDLKNLEWFEDRLRLEIEKVCSPLFVGRVTGKGSRELLFYLARPEEAAATLQGIMDSHQYRPFNFACQPDPEWEAVSKYWK